MSTHSVIEEAVVVPIPGGQIDLLRDGDVVIITRRIYSHRDFVYGEAVTQVTAMRVPADALRTIAR